MENSKNEKEEELFEGDDYGNYERFTENFKN